MVKCNSGLLLLSATVSFAIASPAAAESAAEASPAMAGMNIEDIVVTARRVAESLQTVPVSVSAIQAADIQQRFTNSIADLEGMAPNVQISRDTSYPSVAQFSIRGETTLDPARYSEPSVIVALDQVFQPSVNGALVDMFDVERMEILRGPQGTLFGRNTIGGVVNITRKRPVMNEYGGEAEATYGRWDRVNLKGALNIPLVEDVLAARASVVWLNGGGFVRNEYYKTDSSTGKRRLGDDTITGRLALLFTPTEDLSIYTNALVLRGTGDAGASWNMTPPEFSQCAVFEAEACGKLKNTRLYDNRANINKQNTEWYSVEANLDRSWGTLTGIGSYINESQRQSINFDASELYYYDSEKKEDAETKTLELRYSGEPLAGVALQFGGFFMRENNSYSQDNRLFFSTEDFPQAGRFKSKSDAVFTQLDWTVMPDLRLSGGIRYTRDKKYLVNFHPLAIGPDFNPAPIVTVGGLSQTYKKPTYRIGADWSVSDTVFLFASYARGYRAGGFNGRAGSLASATVPYDPEVADSYEAGAKLTLLDRRLTLNLAAFRVDKRDLQVENIKNIVFNGVPVIDTVIDNAATARIDGFEAEAAVNLPTGTRIGAMFGYLDARYREFLTSCSGICTPGTTLDLSGKPLRRSPKYQFAVNAEQVVSLAWGSLTGNVNYRWKSSQEFVIDSHPLGHQGSVGLLDASLTYRTPDENISLSAYGKNLTNKQYKEAVFVVPSLGFVLGSLNRPIEWGVQANYKF